MFSILFLLCMISNYYAYLKIKFSDYNLFNYEKLEIGSKFSIKLFLNIIIDNIYPKDRFKI
jgi:hypothetical protein